jgi:hypothetical protein
VIRYIGGTAAANDTFKCDRQSLSYYTQDREDDQGPALVSQLAFPAWWEMKKKTSQKAREKRGCFAW